MAVYRTRVGTIAFKQETTEGTAETTSLAQTVRVQNLQFNPDLEQTPRPIQSANFGSFASVPGGKKASVTFDVYPTGAASLATLGSSGSEIHALLAACGFEPTL